MSLAENMMDGAAVTLTASVLTIFVTAMSVMMGLGRRSLAKRIMLLAFGMIGIGALVAAAAMLMWVGDGNPLAELFPASRR